MAGAGAFSIGAAAKVNDATISPTPRGTSPFQTTSGSTAVSPASTRPSPFTIAPQTTFSFGQAPSSAIKEEDSSISQKSFILSEPSPILSAPRSLSGSYLRGQHHQFLSYHSASALRLHTSNLQIWAKAPLSQHQPLLRPPARQLL
jgi:hypothetical protein